MIKSEIVCGNQTKRELVNFARAAGIKLKDIPIVFQSVDLINPKAEELHFIPIGDALQQRNYEYEITDEKGTVRNLVILGDEGTWFRKFHNSMEKYRCAKNSKGKFTKSVLESLEKEFSFNEGPKIELKIDIHYELGSSYKWTVMGKEKTVVIEYVIPSYHMEILSPMEVCLAKYLSIICPKDDVINIRKGLKQFLEERNVRFDLNDFRVTVTYMNSSYKDYINGFKDLRNCQITSDDKRTTVTIGKEGNWKFCATIGPETRIVEYLVKPKFGEENRVSDMYTAPEEFMINPEKSLLQFSYDTVAKKIADFRKKLWNN